ncbi:MULTISPECIES: hypothetical protein [Colwellia]|uniref:Uncharacterized protein n=1 Tax=Colwellia marinimaniae TaxID=1513592 RepID=A0ABQ0MWD0_9GAMM|nr:MULTISPECIES: hypothetical protein [Colwellia]GAW96679.1 hypothetical protein MTCD1_02299 [Colwellia marinimaniae]
MININPSTQNHLGYAIYFPAAQSNYATEILKPHTMPSGLDIKDLNFLNRESRLFCLHVVLYSAGVEKPWKKSGISKTIATERVIGANQDSLIMIDSGGFQADKITFTLKVIESIYRYQLKYADLAPLIDIPTNKMYDQLTGRKRLSKFFPYTTLASCLQKTLYFQDVYIGLGAQKHDKFLNVLQGEGFDDCRLWYEAIKLNPLHGWAIGAGRANNFTVQLHRIIWLLEDGMFDRESTWIHFFGISDLKTSVLLTAILRGLRKYLAGSCVVEMSYDTRSPFYNGVLAKVEGRPIISPKRTAPQAYRFNQQQWINNPEPFPYQFSEISKYLTKGHIVTDDHGSPKITPLGYLLMQNHNLDVTVRNIDTMHQIIYGHASYPEKLKLIPRHLMMAVGAIDCLFDKKNTTAMKSLLNTQQMQWKLNNAYKNN